MAKMEKDKGRRGVEEQEGRRMESGE